MTGERLLFELVKEIERLDPADELAPFCRALRIMILPLVERNVQQSRLLDDRVIGSLQYSRFSPRDLP